MPTISKDAYFGLLDDSFKYDAHKEDIEDYLKKKAEHEEEAKKSKNYMSMFNNNSTLPDIKSISIADDEYKQLKEKSEKINIFESNELALMSSYESYKQRYEKELNKVWKLTELLAEHLTESDTMDLKILISRLLE
jgi:hypothetical protein